jgi:hypothetical protein
MRPGPTTGSVSSTSMSWPHPEHTTRTPTRVPARLVEQLDGRHGEVGPLVAPLHECGIDGKQRAALCREAVLVELARGVLGAGPTFKDPVVDEPVQTVREHVAGQPDPALEVLETARAVEGLAQDHPHPAFTDDAGRAGDRAVLVE